MLKNQKGITLIALIAIIAFLILVLIVPIVNTIIYNKNERKEQFSVIQAKKQKEIEEKLAEEKNKNKKSLANEIDFKNLINLSTENIDNFNQIQESNTTELETNTIVEVAQVTEEVNKEYNGSVDFELNIKIKEYIELVVPSIFVNDSANNVYSYYYSSTGSDHFFDCEFSVICPKDYNNAEELVKKVCEYYEGDPVSTESFADTTWYTTRYKHNDNEVTYICATEKNGYVFLIDYMIDYDYEDKAIFEEHFKQIKNNFKFLK